MNVLLVFIVGACVGSFLNVCICRIPAGKSVIFPRSRCGCGEPIPFWLNIPILSWLFLRGKARCCGRSISPRYLVVELLTACLFTALFLTYPFIPNFVIGCVFCSILTVVSFIDIDTMEISDALSIGGMVVGVVLSTIFPSWYSAQISSDTVLDHLDALVYSIVGVASGSGLMFWIAILGEMAFKKEAVGFGDIKLMGMIGSFIRWNGCLFAIFGGCLICGIIALPILIFLKVFKGKDFKMSGEIPFAPFIVVGSVAYVLYGQDLIAFVCGTGY